MSDDALFAVESEVELIAAAMAAPDECQEAFATVRREHFHDGVHGFIWEKILEVRRDGRQPLPVIIRDRIGAEPSFEDWGGLPMLVGLWDKGQAFGIQEHVEAILDRAGRRALLALSNDLASRARDLAGSELTTAVADAEAALTAITEAASSEDACVVEADVAMDHAIDRMDEVAAHGRPRGLKTGLRCWDYRCRGMQPGWLIVLAGRPSMGKTALARSTALSAALRNPEYQFAYFAIEMDREELSHRNLSELSYLQFGGVRAVPYFDMLGVMDADTRHALRRLDRPKNFTIIDTPTMSLQFIRRKLYALKRRGRPLGAVFIDYLQIMQRPPANGRTEAAVIGEITTTLKRLARELNICIVLLSQLNRAVESRDDKIPQMSDLRESGSIEQDANAILLLHREFYYLAKKEPKGGENSPEYKQWEEDCERVRRELTVHVPKVRAGPSGRDKQAYWAEYDHVEDRADDAQDDLWGGR